MRERKLDYLCNCKSELSNVCNAVEDHCFQAIKIVRHRANDRFDWSISGHQSTDPSRKAIFILSGKHKRFTFVHPVDDNSISGRDLEFKQVKVKSKDRSRWLSK